MKSKIIVICVYLCTLRCRCVKNNVCENFNDYYTIRTNPRCSYNFAAESTVPEIIQKSGYPFETYKVTSPDGYITTVFRIPNTKSKVRKKEPVFLMHGIFAHSGYFVAIDKSSLAFLLSDAGYDVWLANYRGTEYSQEHVNLTADHKEYWNFSLDEMGLYDLPLQLSLVAQVTGGKGNIIFIGYSLGSTLAMIYGTSFPEQSKRYVKLFVYMAPVGKIPNMISPYKLAVPFRNNIMNFLSLNNFYGVHPQMFLNCRKSPKSMKNCIYVQSLFFGTNNQLVPKILPVYFNIVNGNASIKLMLQCTDLILNRFRKFDYGDNNFGVYGTTDPPLYDLGKFLVPVYVIYSVSDWIAGKQDSRNLYYSLPEQVRFGIKEIDREDFSHIDFVFSKNSKTIVHDGIIQLLNNVTGR